MSDLQSFHWSTNNSANRPVCLTRKNDKGCSHSITGWRKKKKKIAYSSIHFPFPLSLSLFLHPQHLVMSNEPSYQANLKQALLAGAMAGTAVDTALFPLGNCQIMATHETRSRSLSLFLSLTLSIQTRSRHVFNHRQALLLQEVFEVSTLVF